MAALVAALVALAVAPYGANVSSLLKIDENYGRQYDLPPGVVLYRDGGYDGMLFHQIARELPAFARGEAPGPDRGEPRPDRPYRWQRVLLPLAAYAAVLGRVDALPWGFLAVNVACVLASVWLFARTTGCADVHALAVALNPAALTGLLFSTAEPLSILLVAGFLLLWRHAGCRATPAQAALLGLAAFAREVNLFVTAAAVLYVAWQRRWREALLLSAGVVPFLLWHVVLFDRFDAWPLLRGNHAFDIPAAGIASMLALAVSGSRNALSSSVFLVAFLLPLVFLLPRSRGQRVRDALPRLALAPTVALMLCMHLEIWEAITGIGRVLPALYPLAALVASDADTPAWRALSTSLCVVSVVAAVGVALSTHPWVLT